MQKTNISYVTHSWNPLAMRCTPVSEGCQNCWHLRMCDRQKNNPLLSAEVRAAKAGGKPIFLDKDADVVMNAKENSKIAVQFMGDLFHESINIRGTEINRVFKLMGCSYATFLVLTKRSDRMAKSIQFLYGDQFPDIFPNVWLGVSCENQEWADKRIPILLNIPAAVRWISLEPMLEGYMILPLKGVRQRNNGTIEEIPIDWVIVGCESGPHRRPCKLKWVFDIVSQCKAANVPCYVKQVEINGKVSHTPSEWPEELRVRQMPERK